MEKLTKKEKKELRKEEFLKKQEEDKKAKLKKQIGIWVGVAAVIVLSILGLMKLASISTSETTPSNEVVNVPKVTEEDITYGSESAKVTLIEYADFQCPACASYLPMVQALKADYPNDLLFVYRFFPLSNVHRNAEPAAQAALAANEQGKFWELHDMLYQAQNEWANAANPKDLFLTYAEKLELNTNKLSTDMEKEEFKKIIQKQQDGGINIGVNSTPTFFLNGKRLQNPRTYQEFKSLIDQELNK